MRIQPLSSPEEYQPLLTALYGDPALAPTMFTAEQQMRRNMSLAFQRPDEYLALGAYQDGQLAGVFILLHLPDDHYLEMTASLTNNPQAYDALFAHLEAAFPGDQVDFYFNAAHRPLIDALTARRGKIDPEIQTMVLKRHVPPVDTTGVVPFSPTYAEQYFALHTKDCYWTGQRVIAAPERFRVFLAIENGQVAGYIDVTCDEEENEPFDLLVAPSARRRGHGRRLLAKAIEANHPHGMMLMVLVSNRPAIALYESMGFEAVPGQNHLTAHWQIPTQETR